MSREPIHDSTNSGDTNTIDRLVGTHLDNEATDLDCSALLNRILTGMRVEAEPGVEAERHTQPGELPIDDGTSILLRPAPHRIITSRRSVWLFVTAASILIAFAAGRWESSAYASAGRLVRAARSTHAMALERCYVVTSKIVGTGSNAEEAKSSKAGFLLSNANIWTQGNRFWVDIKQPKRNWAWGRNAEGAVWLALGNNRGLQIEADEIAGSLEQICDWHSLEIDSLLESFQTRWTLTNRKTTDTSYVISAQPKRVPFHHITGAVVEIDRETKAIRRLTIRRAMAGAAEMEVDFVLVETRVPDESLYQLEGHLKEPYQISTRERFALKRSEFLKSWFGTAAESWIKKP